MNLDEHPTSNIQRRTSNGSANPRSLRRSVFDVGCSMFPSVQGSMREIFRGNLSPDEGEGESMTVSPRSMAHRATLRERGFGEAQPPHLRAQTRTNRRKACWKYAGTLDSH